MNKQELIKIYKAYNLNDKDVFSDPRGFTTIKRSGIEKIQLKSNIQVRFEIITCSLENVVIKGISYIQNDSEWIQQIETFGSASVKNCKQHFLAETAEIRCLSRAIIKTLGFTNTYGYDELKHQPNE